MTSLLPRPRAYSNPPQAARSRPQWFESSKAYHATGAWGKKGMTLQELTQAFDAFNEDEERVAIDLAWSEDHARKLAEPLSGVKTVFSDLDGLKPVSVAPPAIFASTSSYSQSRHVGAGAADEFGCVLRAAESADILKPSTPSLRDVVVCGASGVDEDTIKPSHRRRRTLSAVSPLDLRFRSESGAEAGDGDSAKDPEDVPPRPPSRLGFFDTQGEDEDEEDEDSTPRERSFRAWS